MESLSTSQMVGWAFLGLGVLGAVVVIVAKLMPKPVRRSGRVPKRREDWPEIQP